MSYHFAPILGVFANRLKAPPGLHITTLYVAIAIPTLSAKIGCRSFHDPYTYRGLGLFTNGSLITATRMR
jgi:hypothetical protein